MENRPSKTGRCIVFVSFESEFAKSGGLGAVMSLLPHATAVEEEECFTLAPHFPQITNLARLKEEGRIRDFSTAGSFAMSIAGQELAVEITEVTGKEDYSTYLLSTPGFFTAPQDPYVNPADSMRPVDPYTNPNNPHKLAEDALFFCAAVPEALATLKKTHNLVLHLQDWETACVAKALRTDTRFPFAACILTLHNPYDRYLPPASGFSPVTTQLAARLNLATGNVLPQVIPILDGPLSTVSQNFADELTISPLHNEVFAEHLQPFIESKGLVGIDNGLFGKHQFPFSAAAKQAAEEGNFEPLQEEKWARRERLANVLGEYQQQIVTQRRESWGADLELSDLNLPVFLVIGRDDPRQKGFDVVASAIEMIPPGRARYIFTPMPGDEGFVGLEFLKRLAMERPGEVKVFPFKVAAEAFTALQQGSSYMVMCSLYEPFGAATEAYLAGMPVVGRATGGLVQQVAPAATSALSRHGRQIASLFHDRNSPPTGFLFREPAVVDRSEGWQKIIDCDYWNATPKGDRVEDRKGTPLFDAMSQRAAWALQDAIELYQSDQLAYAEMIYSGFQILDRFGWSRAVREYRRLYDRVCS